MTELDPILEARVDLLEQALGEVNKIRRAMDEQGKSLGVVDDFLGRTGQLAGYTKEIWMRLSDTVNRLESPWDGADDGFGDELEDPQRNGGTAEALSLVRDALLHLKKLEQSRREAAATFVGIQRWSVAGLATPQLDTAVAQYRKLVDKIRKDPEPWRAYEQQLLGRGEELFTAYFELLSLMAVREFGVDAELTKDRNQLLTFLLRRTGLGQLPSFPAPNLLTHTDHVQLGYAGWSLWVLPLIAREAALHMMRTNGFSTEIPEHYRTLCADVFSVYALGPSYPCALIYLELDPGPSNGAVARRPLSRESKTDASRQPEVSDLVRAEVLLDLLPTLGSEIERPALDRRVEQLRSAWRRARAAFIDDTQPAGATAHLQGEVDRVAIPEEASQMVDRFLEELRSNHYEVAFDMRSLVNAQEWLEHLLAADHVELPEGTVPVRDLLIAMWGARLDQPHRCGVIHQRAHELTSRDGPGGAPDPGRRLSRA